MLVNPKRIGCAKMSFVLRLHKKMHIQELRIFKAYSKWAKAYLIFSKLVQYAMIILIRAGQVYPFKAKRRQYSLSCFCLQCTFYMQAWKTLFYRLYSSGFT
jgi:hypothetical protein